MHHRFAVMLTAVLLFATGLLAHAQQRTPSSMNLPRVVIPTSGKTVRPVRPSRPSGRVHPWRKNITATVFWIGEQPTANNPTPNCKSSWDQQWMENFGGYDDPDPDARIADHGSNEFRPKEFVPELNPFYIALPYNDVATYRSHKSEAARVIPWFKRLDPDPGDTTLKGRWIEIYHDGRRCFAQWEDCGPFVTDDWQYVFGNKRPKNRNNRGAAIDISPAVRDYLDLRSGEKCHWRFVDKNHVAYGPWKKYGEEPEIQESGKTKEEKRRYFEYLSKLRDEQYKKRTLNEIQNR